jgi:diguanylate cyclase (GGDEF)-like protein
MFRSPYTNSPVVAIGVPVWNDGKIVYCLQMMLKADAFVEVLREQRLPDARSETVADRAAMIVASTRDPASSIGKTLLPALQQAASGDRREAFDITAPDGVAVKAAVARVPHWGWTVIIDIPLTALKEPMLDGLRHLAIADIFFLAAGMFAAAWVSRYLLREVRLISQASAALSGGSFRSLPPSGISEFDEMGKALAAARTRQHATASALQGAVRAQQETAAELLSARHDPLTGIANRSLFMESAEARQAACSKGEAAIALMFLDLDGLKRANDQWGHERGDVILVATARILEKAVRSGDVVGRVGGDEFAVCITAPPTRLQQSADLIAQRIIAAVGEIGGVGCSIGIALAPQGHLDVTEAMRRADAAMYQAKRSGGNQVMLFVLEQ